MKVLMFGWEFPPHISGGLGIACFGLTRSLSKEETQILFVIPKARGDETGSATIISASDVGVPIHNTTDQQSQVKSKHQNGLGTSGLFEGNRLQKPNEEGGRHSFNTIMPQTKDGKKGLRYSFTGMYGP